jgi:hypothetical protein
MAFTGTRRKAPRWQLTREIYLNGALMRADADHKLVSVKSCAQLIPPIYTCLVEQSICSLISWCCGAVARNSSRYAAWSAADPAAAADGGTWSDEQPGSWTNPSWSKKPGLSSRASAPPASSSVRQLLLLLAPAGDCSCFRAELRLLLRAHSGDCSCSWPLLAIAPCSCWRDFSIWSRADGQFLVCPLVLAAAPAAVAGVSTTDRLGFSDSQTLLLQSLLLLLPFI